MIGNSVGDADAWHIESDYEHSARDINHSLNNLATLFGDDSLLDIGAGNPMETSNVRQKLLNSSPIVKSFICQVKAIVDFIVIFVFISVRSDGANRDVSNQGAIPFFVNVSNFDVLDRPVRRSVLTTPSAVVRLASALNGGA